MPKKFIKCVKAVSKKMKGKYYIDIHGHKVKSSSYAICRKSTRFYGSTHHKRRLF